MGGADSVAVNQGRSAGALVPFRLHFCSVPFEKWPRTLRSELGKYLEVGQWLFLKTTARRCSET